MRGRVGSVAVSRDLAMVTTRVQIPADALPTVVRRPISRSLRSRESRPAHFCGEHHGEHRERQRAGAHDSVSHECVPGFEPWKSQPRAKRAVRLPPVQIPRDADGVSRPSRERSERDLGRRATRVSRCSRTLRVRSVSADASLRSCVARPLARFVVGATRRLPEGPPVPRCSRESRSTHFCGPDIPYLRTAASRIRSRSERPVSCRPLDSARTRTQSRQRIPGEPQPLSVSCTVRIA